MIVSVLAAQQAVEDPVMKIQSQRSSSGEGDLPPVPRGIVEPPPLPAPETHVKDTRGWRASRTVRKARRTVSKRSKAQPVATRLKKVPKKRP
jgi:hypothetical protein